MRQLIIFLAIVSTVTACASSLPRAQRSEFEDIPVPKGLVLDWSRSTRAPPEPRVHRRRNHRGPGGRPLQGEMADGIRLPEPGDDSHHGGDPKQGLAGSLLNGRDIYPVLLPAKYATIRCR
jgi:hypothetical protein